MLFIASYQKWVEPLCHATPKHKAMSNTERSPENVMHVPQSFSIRHPWSALNIHEKQPMRFNYLSCEHFLFLHRCVWIAHLLGEEKTKCDFPVWRPWIGKRDRTKRTRTDKRTAGKVLWVGIKNNVAVCFGYIDSPCCFSRSFANFLLLFLLVCYTSQPLPPECLFVSIMCMCMRALVYTCECTRARACVYARTCMFVCVCLRVFVCVCVRACVCVCVVYAHACSRVCVCAYVCIVSIYMCVCARARYAIINEKIN